MPLFQSATCKSVHVEAEPHAKLIKNVHDHLQGKFQKLGIYLPASDMPAKHMPFKTTQGSNAHCSVTRFVHVSALTEDSSRLYSNALHVTHTIGRDCVA